MKPKESTSGNLKTDVRVLRPLHVICNYLGVLPNFDADLYEEYENGYSYPIFIILIHLTIYLYGAVGKFMCVAYKLDPTMRLVDKILDLFAMIASVLSVVTTNIIYRKNVFKFLQDLRDVDDKVAELNCSIGNVRVKFYAEIICVQLYFLVYYIYGTYVWVSTLGIDIFKYYMLRDLQIYNILMFSMMLRYYALAIKYRFEALNHVLHRYSEKKTVSFSVQQLNERNTNWSVKKIEQIYTNLTKIMEQYNELFGWNYVTIYVNIVVIFLGPMNTAIVYGWGSKDIGGVSFGWQLIVLCFLWGGVSLILGWAIFSACDQGSSEAARVPKACYLLQQELTESRDFSVIEQLRNFAQHASNVCPQFKAAGFFVISYGIVFPLIGSISSYLIVLIQFNSK